MAILVTIAILALSKLASGEAFGLLVFGGHNAKKQVNLYDLGAETKVCKLSDLKYETVSQPFANIVDDYVTICGGDSGAGQHCCAWQDANWQRAMKMDKRLHSSAITTFDGAFWTFFGGSISFMSSSISTWSTNRTEFETTHLQFEIGAGACSTRVNQSHSFLLKGAEITYFYQEETLDFANLGQGDEEIEYASCGLVHDNQHGYLVVTAGGMAEGSEKPNDQVSMYSLGQNVWLEGPILPEKQFGAASLQFQNTFLTVGGQGHEYYDHVLRFDAEKGWLQLPTRLETPDIWMGATHVLAKNVQCQNHCSN